RWYEVRGEDRDQLARGAAKPVGERAGLVALALPPAHVCDLEIGGQRAEVFGDDARRVVGRVIEHLHLETIARVVEPGDRIEQAPDHETLVEDRQLYGDAGAGLQRRRACRPSLPALPDVSVGLPGPGCRRRRLAPPRRPP